MFCLGRDACTAGKRQELSTMTLLRLLVLSLDPTMLEWDPIKYGFRG
ncbi:MAG: hypothetical protein RMK29_10575 [Myxococcales bacterium]|nr:hypothetical protein [Myxococcota bacterium]MDW8282148.1 hypothetical protein [Myxococcales bacterium]